MIVTKKELIELMKDIPDDGYIMIQMGGHSGASHPIIGVEDSTSVGFWEIRCDPGIDYWQALEEWDKLRDQEYLDHKATL